MGVILYKIMIREDIFFKLKTVRKFFIFKNVYHFPPPEISQNVSGFIMSGGVQAIRSTYVPNSTI